MLLVDRVTSPGLIVRPRPGRTELCGEFVDGPYLRAAAVYAAGSVLACRDAIVGSRPFASLPPQLQVVVRPASVRAGWYVDRCAFGTDLLTHGRRARLRRCDGRRVRAQDHLEAAWGSARAALGARVAASDLAVVDELVASVRPLPGETDAATLGATDTADDAPARLPSPLGAVAEIRSRPSFTVEATAATWKVTVFRVQSRIRAREAYTSIPRAHLARFFDQLEAGALDAVLGEYLALEPAERRLAMTGTEPSIGDVAPSSGEVTERELDTRLATTIPGSLARENKRTRIVEVPGPAITRRGCLPGTKWIVIGGVVVALGIGGVIVASTGGGSDEKQTATSTASVCGSDATGAQIDWSVISKSCNRNLTLGLTYKYDSKPFETATVDVGAATPTATKLFFGMTCTNHNATATQLDNALDPLTGFRGLSLLGVPVAGLQPSGLLQIGVRAPDGAIRTGNGVADSAGYAEVDIPINLADENLILTAYYFPNGSVSGSRIPIAPTDITASGFIDGSFPGMACDRAATLALVPKPTGSSSGSDASKQAKAAIVDSASLYPLLVSFASPGADIDVAVPWTVGLDGPYYEVKGAGVSFDLLPGTNAGGDKAGEAPAFVRAYGASLIFPTSAGTGAAWDDAFPCGPGQLAYTVCGKPGATFGDVAYAKVGAVFDQPVPLEPKSDVRYEFTVGTKTIDLTYTGGKWALAGSDDARVLIRNNVVLLVVPKDEVGTGAYRITTSVGGKHDTQPPANQAAVPLQTTIVAAGVPGKETAQQFVTALASALSNGDTAFLRSRMHPVVIDRYGSAACDAYAAGQHTPTAISARDVSAPSIFAWQSDGLSRDVPDTNEVVATQNGQSSTIHVALVDGLWRWFADCGTPLANAR
jgi:hypothetical protein